MATSSKPYETKASDLKPEWHVVDAEGETLGRLATRIATILERQAEFRCTCPT